MKARYRRAHRGDEGQAAVELALVLPLVALLLLAVVQVVLVVRDQVLVVHAAREGARAAAVDPDPGAARRAALAGAPLAAHRLSLELSGHGNGGHLVQVRVSYRSPTFVPIVGHLIPDVVVGAEASMRREQAWARPPGHGQFERRAEVLGQTASSGGG